MTILHFVIRIDHSQHSWGEIMTFCLTSYARGNEFKHHIPEHDSIVITSDVASEAKCLYYEHSSTFTKKLELLNTDILLHS